MNPRPVDRCVCFNVTFAEMQAVAQAEGLCSRAQLLDRVEFGRNCQMCHPYVDEMLRTGEVRFAVLPQPAKNPE